MVDLMLAQDRPPSSEGLGGGLLRGGLRGAGMSVSDAAREAACAAWSTSCRPRSTRPKPTTSSSITMMNGTRIASSSAANAPRSRSCAGTRAPGRAMADVRCADHGEGT